MPTADRRGRTRRRPDEPPLRGVALNRAMHAAKNDPEAWDALRPRAIRGMTSKTFSAEQAAAMFDAYRRKPIYLPKLPPGNYEEPTE
jgi:hypothetical protein